MRHLLSYHSVSKLSVSIHASVKDATNAIRITEADFLVSIHASVKDATFFTNIPNNNYMVSIHASVKDATIDLFYSMITNEFQSTHL